jgi:hypothetical protein
VVPNSVDHSQFFAPERGKQSRPTVGLLYSTIDWKRFGVALQTAVELHQRNPDLRALCFGIEQPPISCRLSSLSSSTPRTDLRDIYASCDVWLTASSSEGFNLPAMEAMACRTPVVSTRTGWPAEAIVDGFNGACVEVDDVAALTREAERILTLSDAQWRRMSANATRRCARARGKGRPICSNARCSPSSKAQRRSQHKHMDRPVWVVVVNFRTPTLAIACLASIEGMVADLHGGRVVVVDNDSADGSAQQIDAAIRARGWSEWAELLAMPRNGGFAYGNNAGLRRAIERDRSSAARSCSIRTRWSRPARSTRCCAISIRKRRSASPVRESSTKTAGPRPRRTGCRRRSGSSRTRRSSRHSATCSAPTRSRHRWRRSRIRATGSPAPAWRSAGRCWMRSGRSTKATFLYFEEVDFCLRAKQAGWGCAFVPEACVTHLEGASTGIAIGRRDGRPTGTNRGAVSSSRPIGLAGLLWADVLWAFGRCSLSLRVRSVSAARPGAAASRAISRSICCGAI